MPLRTALVQTATPDRFRGRVSAAESVVGAGGPAIGNFRAGVVASATSPGATAISSRSVSRLGGSPSRIDATNVTGRTGRPKASFSDTPRWRSARSSAALSNAQRR